ncbi:nucleotidyltransferase domain-containing protein [bacterium]|nr:nucleotidyltransferase domain-containing protein [bacterium]
METANAVQSTIDSAVEALKARLRDNLHAVLLYGSAVRGNFREGVSDINLLIVLRSSSAEAQLAIREVMALSPLLSPFVMGQAALRRNLRVFATKFNNIRRHYRVLHGEDVFSGWEPEPQLLRLLTLQALCNVKLRLVRQFIMQAERPRSYERFILANLPTLMSNSHEGLRLGGVELPADWRARLPLMAEAFGCDCSVLAELMALREAPRELSMDEKTAVQRRLLAFLDCALLWMEKQWTN